MIFFEDAFVVLDDRVVEVLDLEEDDELPDELDPTSFVFIQNFITNIDSCLKASLKEI